MAASDSINHHQLRMLMTAEELHGTDSIDVQQTPESRFGGAWKTKDAMWKTKRSENRMSGLDKDVAASGVHRPVTLTSGRDVSGSVIGDGHHRIQAAYDADPHQILPVQHDDLDKFLKRP